ncbi:MAG TPA: M24 family metallopeptidase [Anaerolineae bacterium]|nr:M24 family metallopeptidase [Anaerolineae bacterium]
MSELDTKLQRIQDLLKQHQADALLLNRVSSFAWATCGAASYINTASTTGVGSLLITPTGRYLITDNIEAPRFEKEEKLAAQGWEFRTAVWHENNPAVTDLTRGLKLAADGPYPGAIDLSAEMAHLRANLLPEEDERYRVVSKACAEAMNAAIRSVRPGMTEYEIAALLDRETFARSVQPTVNLIATDDRIYNFRHPLPTDKKMDKYAMLVLCGRKYGLVTSVTRLVYFGHLPDDLRRKMIGVANIDAVFITATRPGRTLNQVFQRATEAYAMTGFPNEWHLHHQGGPAGYEPREWLATPASTERVATGQVYAWNPSITGAKSEDTILVGPNGNEVLTAMPDWPVLLVEADGQNIPRPAILEVN